jgi:hypothetical protein
MPSVCLVSHLVTTVALVERPDGGRDDPVASAGGTAASTISHDSLEHGLEACCR